MQEEQNPIDKSISSLYRLSQIYFDAQLGPFHIGCGQQFFLYNIYKHPGISPYELASGGSYDKGTTARAIKKLEDEGYIIRTAAEHDKRSCRLYVTTQAQEVIQATQAAMDSWQQILTDTLSESQAEQVQALLHIMAGNAYRAIKTRRKQENV